MRTTGICLAAALLLGACGNHATQTSSGADYLARYDATAARSGQAATGFDARLREAAAVEPVLVLPGRFGLARIENGRLTAIPGEEAELWAEMAAKHAMLGEFVPVSPLVAAVTAASLGGGAECCPKSPAEIVQTIRLGAARQHLDAVLVYEVGARARRGMTPLALMDLTIIGGAFLPTRTIEARGVASALLLDVRNGYPYGTASAEADLSGLSATWGKSHRTETLRRKAALAVARKLVPEVDAMLGELARKLRVRAAAG